MKEKENLLGQKAATASSSLCKLMSLKRVGGRDVKLSPTGTYSLCLNEGDRGAKIFQGKVFCSCKLAYQLLHYLCGFISTENQVSEFYLI